MVRTLVFASIVTCCAAASADPLFQTLPKDGTGAKFHINLVINGKEQVRTWQIRSTGGREHEGKPARWIELLGEAYDGASVKYRLLIPEAAFGRGKHPIEKAVEVWRKFGDRSAEKIDDFKNADLFLYTLLSGPGDDVRKLDGKEKVQWQKGAFDCDVLVGSTRLALGGLDVEIKHRSFYSDEAPFRFAGTEQNFKYTVNGKTDNVRLEAKLIEIQAQQLSAFPDVK